MASSSYRIKTKAGERNWHGSRNTMRCCNGMASKRPCLMILLIHIFVAEEWVIFQTVIHQARNDSGKRQSATVSSLSPPQMHNHFSYLALRVATRRSLRKVWKN